MAANLAAADELASSEEEMSASQLASLSRGRLAWHVANSIT